MNVFFHGASITQQMGEDSFYQKLIKKNTCPLINFRQYGYGSMSLNSAGFLTINNDAKLTDDICFLDWNSTFLEKFNN